MQTVFSNISPQLFIAFFQNEMLQFVCRGKSLVKLTCEEELNQDGDLNIRTEDLTDVDQVITLLKKQGQPSSPISMTEVGLF
jgi:hypothetical protein